MKRSIFMTRIGFRQSHALWWVSRRGSRYFSAKLRISNRCSRTCVIKSYTSLASFQHISTERWNISVRNLNCILRARFIYELCEQKENCLPARTTETCLSNKWTVFHSSLKFWKLVASKKKEMYHLLLIWTFLCGIFVRLKRFYARVIH